MELSAMIARVLAAIRHPSMVSVTIIQMMVYMTIKVLRPMKPRSCADEQSAVKPFGTVVAIGSTVIRWDFVVPVRTDRCRPNAHRNLSWSRIAAS